MGKLVTCIFYFLLDLNCGFFINQDFGRVLQHKINPEWELHTTLKNAGLLIWLVWTDSLWHLLKFAVIQLQGLGLKYLELHLHVCPSVTVKTSFVFNLAHCVPGGITYAHETTLSSRLARRQTALVIQKLQKGGCYCLGEFLAHRACFWTFGVASCKIQNISCYSLQ